MFPPLSRHPPIRCQYRRCLPPSANRSLLPCPCLRGVSPKRRPLPSESPRSGCRGGDPGSTLHRPETFQCRPRATPRPAVRRFAILPCPRGVRERGRRPARSTMKVCRHPEAATNEDAHDEHHPGRLHQSRARDGFPAFRPRPGESDDDHEHHGDCQPDKWTHGINIGAEPHRSDRSAASGGCAGLGMLCCTGISGLPGGDIR
jgi:hypothetical protein